ncbi:MAG: TlpA family protein disulfide reductase [Acidimicrobiia bacterium]
MTATQRLWLTRGLIAIAISAALVLALVFAGRFGSDPNLTVSPLLDKEAPDRDIPLLAAEGSINLAELDGKVAVVNFWGPWCVWCDDEHPALLSTAEAYADRGVVFVGVAWRSTESAAVEFLDRYGWGNIAYAHDRDLRAVIDFGVFGAPETFFIDPNGVVVAKIYGPTDTLILAQTLDRILAGERPGERTVGETQSPEA